MNRSFIYLFILLFVPTLLHAQSQPQYRVKNVKKDIMTFQQGWKHAFDLTYYYPGNREGILNAASVKEFATNYGYFGLNPAIQYDSLHADSMLNANIRHRLYQKFDQQNLITERRRYDSTLSTGTYTLKSITGYIYDNGLLVAVKDMNGYITTEYKYKNGQLDTIFHKSSSGYVTSIEVFTYNSNNLLHTAISYASYNVIIGTIYKSGKVYEYDANNRVSRMVSMRAVNPNINFDTTGTTEYSYDNNGNLVELYAENRNGINTVPVLREKYFYDANQRIAEEIRWIQYDTLPGLDTTSRLTYTYNNQSLITGTDLQIWDGNKWGYYADTSANWSSHIMTIDYEMYWPTSVAQTSVKEPAVKLYPSPTSDFIRVEAVWKEEKPFDAMICDMQGRVIRQWQEPANRFYSRTIPIPELPAGVYIIRMQCGDEASSKQFVKQ